MLLSKAPKRYFLDKARRKLEEKRDSGPAEIVGPPPRFTLTVSANTMTDILLSAQMIGWYKIDQLHPTL